MSITIKFPNQDYVIDDDVCGCMQINYCPMCQRKLGE